MYGGTPTIYQLPPNYEIPAPVAWGDEAGSDDDADVEAGSDDDADVEAAPVAADVEAGSDDDAEVEADNEGANEDSFVDSEVELEPDEDLPQGWITVTCEESGRLFYHHVATRHSQWARPTDVSTVVGV